MSFPVTSMNGRDVIHASGSALRSNSKTQSHTVHIEQTLSMLSSTVDKLSSTDDVHDQKQDGSGKRDNTNSLQTTIRTLFYGTSEETNPKHIPKTTNSIMKSVYSIYYGDD